MSISRIANNISALTAQRNLAETGRDLQKSIERLSSGLRINRAGDDAAGLSVANRLKTQVEGLNQAVTNASQGINLINVAEGALEETTVRLNRIRQLSVQSANTAVNDVKARNALQDEVFQSIDEITRIANTTQFGSNFLLNGDFSIKTGEIKGQEQIGVNIDASPVASTLRSGKSFLNIVKLEEGSSQIIAGDGKGNQQILNTGITNSTDIAVTFARFSDQTALTAGDNKLTGANATTGTTIGGGQFALNGVSINANDIVTFTGVLSDGVTQFNGSLSVGAAATVGTAAGSQLNLVGAINDAIDDAEKALFGVTNANSVPTAFRTTVSIGTGATGGRLQLFSDGNFINQSEINFAVVRSGNILTTSNGVTRSGEIGAETVLSGSGQIGNSITAITGSTFGTGQFDIQVQDIQAAQQRKVESTISLRDSNGTVLSRSTSISAAVGNNSLVVNGTFVSGVFTGGTSLQNNDTVTLTGTNADGTTFQGTFTLKTGTADSAAADTDLDDFQFNSISGLIAELNFRTRDFRGAGFDDLDGTQTRFEDAIFTLTANGTLQLIDDAGKTDSQTAFTLTFSNGNVNENFTLQDDAELVQEGFAETASFSIEGGELVRAQAGDVITLKGQESTIEGVPTPEVTLRVGTGFSAGADKLETTAQTFAGRLNGGAAVTFQNGNQDVVFVDGTSGGNRGVARFVTVDFDAVIDVTKRTDGLPDTGRTLIISTSNQSLNFHVGANADQAFTAAIGDLSAESLGFGRGSNRTVNDINVSSLEGANDAIRIVDEALDQVNKTRSILGASTNRLEATISNLSVSAENLTASESRIRDADIAQETTNFTRNQVLLQAGQSVLAQANFQSQGFLSLLG